MAIKFLQKLDLQGNEIQNFKAHVASSDSGFVNKGEGSIWLDSASNALKFYVADTGSGSAGWLSVLDNTNVAVRTVTAGGNTLASNETLAFGSGGTNLTISENAGTLTFNVDDAFLKNNANDTTSGTITAGGFTTTGSITLGGHAVNDILIGGDTFANDDSHLMTAAAVEDKILSYSYGTGNGDITGVTITTDTGSSSKATDNSSSADFSILGGEGINVTNSGATITVTGELATTTNPGVANFPTTSFAVANGAVSIKSGGVTNTMLAGSIAASKLAGSIGDSKLSTISTANKVSLTALNIDAGTDIGEALVDADLMIVDNGAGGTNRKATMARLKTYMQNGLTFTSNTDTNVDVSTLETRLGQINSNVTIGNGTGVATTISGGLSVAGNLTVNGTTTTVNSTTVTVDDPVFTIGGDGTAVNDSKDRGIEFKYNDGENRVGFFGYDDSLNAFVAYGAATNTSEVFSGTLMNAKFGTITGTFSGNATTATTLANSRTFRTNLASTSTASFNGGGNVTPGVTGTLAVGNGGTGLTSISTLLNSNVTKSSLGLVIGTNVQAYDAQLDTLAAMTSGEINAFAALTATEIAKIDGLTPTTTELNYVDGVTSAIQTQIDSKQATITGAATTIDDSNLTASRAVISNGSGKVAVSAVTSTELGYLDGVTSAVQTQLNAKQATISSSARLSATLIGDNGNISNAEYNHLNGVSSNIQTQLNAKMPSANVKSVVLAGSTGTTYNIVHSYGTPRVMVQVLDYGNNGTGATYDIVYPEVQRNDDNSVDVLFGTAPGTSQDYIVQFTKIG